MCVLLHSSRFSVVPVCAMVRAGLMEGRRQYRRSRTNQRIVGEHLNKMHFSFGEFRFTFDSNVKLHKVILQIKEVALYSLCMKRLSA